MHRKYKNKSKKNQNYYVGKEITISSRYNIILQMYNKINKMLF